MLHSVCRPGLAVLLLEPDPCKLLHQSLPQRAATFVCSRSHRPGAHTRGDASSRPASRSSQATRSAGPFCPSRLRRETLDETLTYHPSHSRPTPRMPSSRKSTPRRGRSSSVVSNVSTTSAKQEPTSNSTPRRSKAAAAAAKDDGEATPSTPKAAAAAAAAARPALPSRSNPALPNFDVPVKLQVICRDGK